MAAARNADGVSAALIEKFAFAPRSGSIDFRALARFSVDSVVEQGDAQALSRVLPNAVYAAVTEEAVRCAPEAELVALIQTLQLACEYGMHVQTSQAAVIAAGEAEVAGLRAAAALEAAKASQLKAQLRTKRDTLATVTNLMSSTGGGKGGAGTPVPVVPFAGHATLASLTTGGPPTLVFKCALCPKAFRDVDFLADHAARRHPASTAEVGTRASVHCVQPASPPGAEPSAQSGAPSAALAAQLAAHEAAISELTQTNKLLAETLALTGAARLDGEAHVTRESLRAEAEAARASRAGSNTAAEMRELREEVASLRAALLTSTQAERVAVVEAERRAAGMAADHVAAMEGLRESLRDVERAVREQEEGRGAQPQAMISVHPPPSAAAAAGSASLNNSRAGVLDNDEAEGGEAAGLVMAVQLSMAQDRVVELERALEVARSAPRPAVSLMGTPQPVRPPRPPRSASQDTAEEEVEEESGPFRLTHSWQRLPADPSRWAGGGGFTSLADAGTTLPPGLPAAALWATLLPAETTFSASVPPRARIPRSWPLVLPVPSDDASRDALAAGCARGAGVPGRPAPEVRLTVERTTSVRELIAAATTRLGLTEGVLSLTTAEGAALDLDATVGEADLFTQRPLLVVTAPPPAPVELVAAPEPAAAVEAPAQAPVVEVPAPEVEVEAAAAVEAPPAAADVPAPAVASTPACAPVEVELSPVEEAADAGEVVPAPPPAAPAPPPPMSAEDAEAVRRALYATMGAVLGALSRSPVSRAPATLVVAPPAAPAPVAAAAGPPPSPGASLSVPPERPASAARPSVEAAAEVGNEEAGASDPLSPLNHSEAGVTAADAYEAAAATDSQGGSASASSGRPRGDSGFVSPLSAETTEVGGEPTAASDGVAFPVKVAEEEDSEDSEDSEADKEAPPVAEAAQEAEPPVPYA